MQTPFDIFETPAVRISDITARRGRNPGVCPTCIEQFQFALVRRGAFLRRMKDETIVIDSSSVTPFQRDDPYFLEPFGAHGAYCTILSFNEDILPDRLRAEIIARRRLTLPPAAALAAQRVFQSIGTRGASALAVEEASLQIALAIAGPSRPQVRRPSPRERRVVEYVMELIAANPLQRQTLSSIARDLAMSPYHLAHIFKAITGTSIGRYQTRLKLNLALDALAGGQRNLLALACDLGFASHSHMTRLFRREFGVPPSAARAALATSI